MTLVCETDGDIVLDEVRIEWKIKNFSLSDKVRNSYKSPFFNLPDSRWHLSLYPNANQVELSAWVSLYLYRNDSVSPKKKTVYFALGIKGYYGVNEKPELKFDFSKENAAFGYGEFWSRSELKGRKSTLMPNNMLTVTCVLRSEARNAIKGEDQLGKSLRNMLENGDDSDVVIKVEGKEFPAHRAILRARSSVFKSMFAHDTVEKQSGVVKTEDGDPETFQDFLVHLYSGSCEHISKQNVYGLYATADKYDVGELKEACVKFIQRTITIAMFCDIMAFAIKYDDEELEECAANFFCDNSVDIAKTAEWKTFMMQNFEVGNNLFIEAMSK